MEAPEELNGCIVPKLILQPLIENAIIHGFAEKDHGVVIVEAKCENERLCIAVRDNGAGMLPRFRTLCWTLPVRIAASL